MRFLMVVLSMAVVGTPTYAQISADTLRQITVTGQGRSEAAPDMATITLGVVTERPEAADAMRANSEQVADMLVLLAKEGIDARDMQTSNLSLHPRYLHRNNEVPQITGFVANNTVSIRVRELDNLGGILDRVLTSGVNQLHGLSFGFADPQAQQDAARRAAMTEARRKADLYAEAAGVVAMRVISITETGAALPHPVMMMEAQAMSRAADVPIAQGEVTTQAQVTVVYELIDLE